jgi:lipoprotein-releasing system permease protein
MHIASFIGLRFLRSPRRDRAVSIVTWISGIGVALGVTALLVTISVMNGFRANLFLAVTGATPHVRILGAQDALAPEQAQELSRMLETLPGIVATAPYFSRQVFVKVRSQYRMVVLRGIDPEREPRVTEMGRFLGEDVLPPQRRAAPGAGAVVLAGLRAPAGETPGMILGGPLARSLGLFTGDLVEVISPTVRPTPIGPVPIVRHFRLVGVFEAGLAGTDDVLGFVDLRQALLLFRLPGPQGIAARTRDPDADPAPALRERFPGTAVIGWADENKNVFQVMRLEKAGLFLILALILVVSFFNIISSIVMLVVEKREAIGILKALGSSDRLVQGIFFMQGVWIGFIGTAVGVALGLATCWTLAHVEIVTLPASVFPTAEGLPVRVEWLDVLLISACSFLICMTVTVYPARQAARIQPVDSLRFDL